MEPIVRRERKDRRDREDAEEQRREEREDKAILAHRRSMTGVDGERISPFLQVAYRRPKTSDESEPSPDASEEVAEEKPIQPAPDKAPKAREARTTPYKSRKTASGSAGGRLDTYT